MQPSAQLSYIIGQTQCNGSVVVTSNALAGLRKHYGSGRRMGLQWCSGLYTTGGCAIVRRNDITQFLATGISDGKIGTTVAFDDHLEAATYESDIVMLADAFLYHYVPERTKDQLLSFISSVREKVYALYFHDVPGVNIACQIDEATKEYLRQLPKEVILLATTDFLAEDLAKIVQDRIIKVLPPRFRMPQSPLIEAQHPITTESKAKIKKCLDIPKEDLTLLQPTRVAPYKGIDRAVHLASALERRIERNTWVVVTGECNTYERQIERDRILRTAAALDFRHIRFLEGAEERGFTVDALHSGADAVTCITQREGYGLFVFEAAAHGVPYVTTPYVDFGVTHQTYERVYQKHGFKGVIQTDPFGEGIDEDTVDHMATLLTDAEALEKIRQHNFHAAQQLTAYNEGLFASTADVLLKQLNPEDKDSEVWAAS